MAINAVAPWEGELVWIGDVNRGKTISGAEWKSVDFTLKYTDHQMNEKFITFSLFGAGKVSSFSYPLGTWLKVVWWPESTQAKNGKYYSKNSVIACYKIDAPAKSADTKITAPNFPVPQPPMPEEDRSYQPPQDDLPFD